MNRGTSQRHLAASYGVEARTLYPPSLYNAVIGCYVSNKEREPITDATH
jgi:hypothetical protein